MDKQLVDSIHGQNMKPPQQVIKRHKHSHYRHINDVFDTTVKNIQDAETSQLTQFNSLLHELQSKFKQ